MNEKLVNEIIKLCLEECRLHNNAQSFWNRIPASGMLNHERLSCSTSEWYGSCEIWLKRYFLSQDPSVPGRKCSSLTAIEDQMLESHRHRWTGQGWSARISAASRIMKQFKESGFSDLQGYLDSGAYDFYKDLTVELVEEAMSRKAPSKLQIARGLLAVLETFDWKGEFYKDSRMIEGIIGCMGYEFRVVVFIEKQFSFFYEMTYNITDISDPWLKMPIIKNYERAMALCVSDWDLIDVDSLDIAMGTFKEVLTRLLWLNAAALKAANL